jgi:hypothetical protein
VLNRYYSAVGELSASSSSTLAAAMIMPPSQVIKLFLVLSAGNDVAWSFTAADLFDEYR